MNPLLSIQEIEQYAGDMSSPESALLHEISRFTYAQVMRPRMLSGHLQGRLLSMLSHMIRPVNILELGTYTGYSALCLAEGMQEKGQLVTIDINYELEPDVRAFFARSSWSKQIEYRVGPALEILPDLPAHFDLVFIDADKGNYGQYFEWAMKLTQPNAFILVDNVLWSNKVIVEAQDKDTVNMMAFNKAVLEDPRIEKVLLPLRDGIYLLRKIS